VRVLHYSRQSSSCSSSKQAFETNCVCVYVCVCVCVCVCDVPVNVCVCDWLMIVSVVKAVFCVLQFVYVHSWMWLNM